MVVGCDLFRRECLLCFLSLRGFTSLTSSTITLVIAEMMSSSLNFVLNVFLSWRLRYPTILLEYSNFEKLDTSRAKYLFHKWSKPRFGSKYFVMC